MNILVTGGAGFLGAAFVRHLLEDSANHRVINLDCLNYAGHLGRLVETAACFKDRYAFIQADIRKADVIDPIFETNAIDGVINFAAQSHVDRSIRNAQDFITTNVLGTQVLMDAARKIGVRRFLQVSTDEVYGSLGFQSPPSIETDTLKPSSPYSASKAAADLLGLAYLHTHQFPFLISRSCNIYGPWQNPEKMIPHFICQALTNKALPLYGDGRNRRCWLYIRDYVRALSLVWKNGEIGQVYHLKGRDEFSNKEVAEKILSFSQPTESKIEQVPDRLGHDLRYAISAKWLFEKQGFIPEVTFENGLKETILWYKENRHVFEET